GRRAVPGREPTEDPFLRRRGRGVDPTVGRPPEPVGQALEQLAKIGAGPRGHLGREEAEDDPVLVRGPRRSVTAEERSTGALLTAESERAVQQAAHEPLEA